MCRSRGAEVGVGKDGLTWEAGLCLPANLLSVLVTRRVCRIWSSGSHSLPLPTTLQSQSGSGCRLGVLPSVLKGLGGGVCCASFRVTLQQRRRDQGPVSACRRLRRNWLVESLVPAFL